MALEIKNNFLLSFYDSMNSMDKKAERWWLG